MNMFFRFLFSLGFVLLAPSTAPACPQKFAYQGYFANLAGTPVNASASIVFKRYDVALGGSTLYSEAQIVAVNNGVFNALTGSVAPLALPFDVQYYLGITVDAGPEMTPRSPRATSPHAIRSVCADATTSAIQIGGVDAARMVQSDAAGNVTIAGTLNVNGALSYRGVNAQGQFKLGGQRILSSPSTPSFFAGAGAGCDNTIGDLNNFVGGAAAVGTSGRKRIGPDCRGGRWLRHAAIPAAGRGRIELETGWPAVVPGEHGNALCGQAVTQVGHQLFLIEHQLLRRI